MFISSHITFTPASGHSLSNYGRNGDCIGGRSMHTLDRKHQLRISNINRLGGYGKVIFVFKEKFGDHDPRYKKITDNGMMYISNAYYDSDIDGISHEHEINSIICEPRDILHFRGFVDELTGKKIWSFPTTLMAKAERNVRSGLIEMTRH